MSENSNEEKEKKYLHSKIVILIALIDTSMSGPQTDLHSKIVILIAGKK